MIELIVECAKIEDKLFLHFFQSPKLFFSIINSILLLQSLQRAHLHSNFELKVLIEEATIA